VARLAVALLLAVARLAVALLLAVARLAVAQLPAVAEVLEPLRRLRRPLRKRSPRC
jgi:hypothetical protein